MWNFDIFLARTNLSSLQIRYIVFYWCFRLNITGFWWVHPCNSPFWASNWTILSLKGDLTCQISHEIGSSVSSNLGTRCASHLRRYTIFFLLKSSQKWPKIVKITVFLTKIPYFLCDEYPKCQKMSEKAIKSSLSIPWSRIMTNLVKWGRFKISSHVFTDPSVFTPLYIPILKLKYGISSLYLKAHNFFLRI